MRRVSCRIFLFYVGALHIFSLGHKGKCSKLPEPQRLCSSNNPGLCTNLPIIQHNCEKVNQIGSFHGHIYSPLANYGNGTVSYPPQVNCAWYIKIPTDSVITLSFPLFELEEGHHHCSTRPCCGDTWLSILSIPSQPALPATKSHVQESINFIYCGALSLPPLVFSGSGLILTFRTGEIVQGGRGFLIDYTIDKPSRNSCDEDHFHCKNGKCILKSWLCNGWDECGDYSDEHNCNVTCLSGHARCNTNSTLCYDFNRGRCNGILDCPGGEDEHACALHCGSQMACRTRGGCYQTSVRCNGQQDCTDGSDEEACDGSLCGPHRDGFLCRNQRCIPALSKCDGIQDCGDFSDEDSCMRMSMITAAILGSLICGLLLIIATGCGLRLYRLRVAIEQRWSSIRLQHRTNHNHDYDEFGQRRPVMGRQPPPSYAQATGAPEPLTSSTSAPSRHRRSHRHRRPAPPLPGLPVSLPQRNAEPRPSSNVAVDTVSTIEIPSSQPGQSTTSERTFLQFLRHILRKNSAPNSLNEPSVDQSPDLTLTEQTTSCGNELCITEEGLIPTCTRIDNTPAEDDSFDTEPLIESQP